MRTYRLYRVESTLDEGKDTLLGFMKASSEGAALDKLEPTIRAQQVGTIMELCFFETRGSEESTVLLSNDISRYYVYPKAA